MTSFTECLKAKVAAGRIDAKKTQKVIGDFEALKTKYERLGDPNPEARARGEVLERMDWELEQRQYRLLLQIRKAKEVRTILQGVGRPGEGAKSILKDWQRRTATNTQLARGMFLKGLRELNQGSKEKRTASMRALVGEIFEEGTAPEVGHLAKAWRETSDWLVDRFTEAGGRLRRRKDWHLPQSHSALALDKVSADEWIDFILPKLDLDRMGDLSLGRPFEAAELREILTEVYETIRTGGLNKLTPSLKPGGQGRSVALGRMDQRFLQFRDADSWLAYNEKFGSGNALESILDHIDSMSHDIAGMQVLGPNPKGMMSFMEQEIMAGALAAPRGKMAKARSRAKSDIDFVHTVYDVLTGVYSTPVSARGAKVGSEVRAWLGAAQLGSAQMSAFSDIATTAVTAHVNDIPQAKVWKRMTTQMVSEASQEQAARAGFIGDRFVSSIRETRWHMDVMEASYGSKALDMVLRYSFLKGWTDGMRETFTLEFSGMLADQLGTSWGNLSKKVQTSFGRYRITDKDWDLLRQTRGVIDEPEPGVKFIDFINLMKSDDKATRDAAMKFHGMILGEREYAVVNPDAFTEAWMHKTMLKVGKRGTIVGEASRSGISMYKSFPVSLMILHGGRALFDKSFTGWGRAAYGTALMLGLLPFGAARVQFDQMAWGRDPLDMSDPKFWGAALLRSGGLTIVGDIIFSDHDRFGHSVVSTMLGPGAGLVEDLSDVFGANVARAIKGKETHFLADFVNKGRRYVPGGNLWYTRMAFQRMVLDQIAEMVDPSAKRKWAKRENQYRKDYNSGTYWRPGSMLPRRTPDFANALGD